MGNKHSVQNHSVTNSTGFKLSHWSHSDTWPLIFLATLHTCDPHPLLPLQPLELGSDLPPPHLPRPPGIELILTSTCHSDFHPLLIITK